MKAMKCVARILVSIAVVFVTNSTIPATAQNQTVESAQDLAEKAVAAYEQGDYVMAFVLFGAAAEEGHAQAQGFLGLMYARGEGVARNDAEAVRWYRRAAEQGDPVAQSLLGSMYADGRGVEKDEAEAFHWFRLAAEQGDAEAQAFLGAMYADGVGVKQDDVQAVRWLRRAAAQGVAAAQTLLERLYEGASKPVASGRSQSNSVSDLELFIAGGLRKRWMNPNTLS